MKYRYDSEAREEYRNAIHFYGKAAERFFDAVESTIVKIRRTPTQFREIEPGVRVCRVPNFPYAIYYIIESSEIVIVAVKHNRRDPGYWVIEFHDKGPSASYARLEAYGEECRRYGSSG